MPFQVSDTDPSLNIGRFIRIAFWVVAVVLVYEVAWALFTSQTTGILDVQANLATATLSISQVDKQAQTIGTGKAHIRIAPGTYLVSAAGSGKRTSQLVTVTKKSTTKAALDINKGSVLASADSINFVGESDLVDSGISVNQITVMEQAFFTYKPAAKTILVVPGSVSPAPHNPDTDTGFTLNFKVTIDSTPYNAALSYTDTNTARLFIYDPGTNALLFDSGAVENPGG